MRVLVTALGSIAAPFVVDTIKKMGLDVVGVDIHPRSWVAASTQVHAFAQVPLVSRFVAYERTLLRLCRQYDVGLIVPLTDPEVDYLTARASYFATRGVIVAAPSNESVKLMRNKLSVHKHFSNSRLRTIPTFQREEYLNSCNIFPCIAKKIEGRSSEGVFVIENPSDLRRAELQGDDYIFQPFVDGPVLVADVLKSGAGAPIIVTRRELTRTKNGAGIAVQIMDNDAKVRRSVEFFCKAVDFEGCINIEFISPRDGEVMLMDINPRFSAGVSFSALAGYNFVCNHIRHYLGLPVEPLGSIARNAVFTRKYTEVVACL